jgi:hypothetical protein
MKQLQPQVSHPFAQIAPRLFEIAQQLKRQKELITAQGEPLFHCF